MAGKSNKLKVKKLQINFTDKWFYTFVVVISLIVIGIGVYAVNPGESGDPGHNIDSIGPPIACDTDQYLQWTGSVWTCVEGGSGDMSNVAFTNISETFDENLIITKNLTVGAGTLFVDSNTDKVGIGILNPEVFKLAVGGPLFSSGIIYTDGYGDFKKGLILGDSETCSSDFVGMLRYRKFCSIPTACSTYLELCMQNDTNEYDWAIIYLHSWVSEGGGGEEDEGEGDWKDIMECSPGHEFWWCTTAPGCYESEPDHCYWVD